MTTKLATRAKQLRNYDNSTRLRTSNVVDQVRLALKPRYRLATCLGFLLGGFVPLATFFVAHQLSSLEPLYAQKGLYLVLGGLAYSARTVWQWGRMAFANAFKAAGFVVLLEGVMVTSHIVCPKYRRAKGAGGRPADLSGGPTRPRRFPSASE